MTSFEQKHYEKFKNSFVMEETWASTNIENWWKYVTGKVNGRFPSSGVTRQTIKLLCADDRFSDEECMGAVMAWGGQRRGHGRTLFSRKGEITPIICAMRQNTIDHFEAYDQLHRIWKGKAPLGMGAAYFTKLIYFCDPHHKGYIMDQWTSKSVNLMCGANLVHLSSGYVSKKNDWHVYEKFCSLVDEIAVDLCTSAESVEMAMFSKGGRKKAAWRQYVVDNYKKRPV